MRIFQDVEQQYSEAAGQYFADGEAFGSGVLISPRLFLTAGHCVLPEAGEYTLFDDGKEEYVRSNQLGAPERSNAEIAQLMVTLEYSPNVKMENVTSSSVVDANSTMEIKFNTRAGEIKRTGKVLCGVCAENYEMDFALIELDEPVMSIQTPSLCTAPAKDEAIIFHYPEGGEKVASPARIVHPPRNAHQFKISYFANTSDKSSGAALLNKNGQVFAVHNNRDLVFDEVDEMLRGVPEDEAKSLEELEEIFRRTDGKMLHATFISEILAFRCNATDKFKEAMERHQVPLVTEKIATSQAIGM